MILDWECPKYLLPLVAEVEGRYWTDRSGTKEHKNKTNQAIACIVHNMVREVAIESDTVCVPLRTNPYSVPLVYNGNEINRKVSRKAVKRVLEWLDDTGLVALQVGGVISWESVSGVLQPKETQGSKVVMSDYLIDIIKPYADKKRLITNRSVIELRDREGKPLARRLGPYQREVKNVLERYNVLARNTDITLHGVQYRAQLTKIYNLNFGRGGRLYLNDDPRLYSELLRRENRGEILLDGERTIELDYKHLHMALICELDGITLDPEFDPYQIMVRGFSRKGARWVGKLAALVLINAGVGRRGVGGLIQAIREDSRLKDLRYYGHVPDVIKYREVFDAILERNPYLLPHSKEPIGMKLQNLDGMMVDAVIGELNFIDEIALPMHDSFIVKEGLRDFTRDKMQKAYRAVMGSDNNCRIEEK